MTFEQQRFRLTTHFSERIPVVKRRMNVLPASEMWRNVNEWQYFGGAFCLHRLCRRVSRTWRSFLQPSMCSSMCVQTAGNQWHIPEKKSHQQKKGLATSDTPNFTGSLATDFRLNHQLWNLYEWHRKGTDGYRGRYANTLCVFNIKFVKQKQRTNSNSCALFFTCVSQRDLIRK